MKKTSKRILGIAAVALLVAVAMVGGVSAAAANGQSGGISWEWVTTTNPHTVIYTGTGTSELTSSIVNESLSGHSGNFSASISTGITSIGDGAFQSLTPGVTSLGAYLYGITINEGVITIGSSAFNNCQNLNGSFTIPSTVVTIKDSAFKYCPNVTSVTLTDYSDLMYILPGAFNTDPDGSALTVALPGHAKNGDDKTWKCDGTVVTSITGDNRDKYIYATVEPPHSHNEITFDKKITAAGGELTSGNYYLPDDIELTNNITIPASAIVNVCLNGHVLKGNGNGSVIKVSSGATLNLYDCDTTTENHFKDSTSTTGLWEWDSTEQATDHIVTGGCITGGSISTNGGGVYVDGNGEFTMNGGNIVGNVGGVYGGGVFVSGGTFTLNGGTICGNVGNSGGGVGVCSSSVSYNEGTFNMTGGSITGNTATWFGGGVDLYTGKDFIMTGGSITGNNAKACGGVYVVGKSFTMTGGSITDNTATNLAGGVGVCLIDDQTHAVIGTATIGGTAQITGNTYNSDPNNLYLYSGNVISVGTGVSALQSGASIGVTMKDVTGTFTSNGTADDAQYFNSDDTKYNVQFDNGQLKLVMKVSVTGVTLNKTKTVIPFGNTETLIATVSPTDATDKSVTWSSSDDNVATVNNGVVSGVSVGNATITVTTTDGGYTATCNVTVGTPVRSVEMNKTETKIAVGSSETLIAKVSPSDATIQTVTWSSDNEDVATVDDDGKVTAVSNGDATITVTTVDGEFTATCDVTVYTPSSGSSVTSFFGEKNGNDFTFDKAVVITKATLPGASSATVTNTSGAGWYNCNLTTDSITGNGILYFQVPLDVLKVKGYTVNDVSLVGSKTTYLKSENGYAKYSAVITKGGALTIDFEEDATTTTAVEKVQEVVEQKQETVEQKQETAEKVQETVEQIQTTVEQKQTAAKSPFPVLGILAGLCAAGFVALRRK